VVKLGIYNKIRHAAKMTGISVTMLKEAIKNGQINYIRTGINNTGHYMVDMDSLNTYLDSKQQRGQTHGAEHIDWATLVGFKGDK
jgi:predicted site-specific integrase-resolvase